MKLINIGFGNMISAGRLVAIVSPDSAPIKRMVQEARRLGVTEAELVRLVERGFGGCDD